MGPQTLALLLGSALPAQIGQALSGTLIPCAPPVPYVACGTSYVGPQTSFGVTGQLGTLITFRMIAPTITCHEWGPNTSRLCLLVGSHAPLIQAQVTIGPIPNVLGVVPTWIVPMRQYSPVLWRESLPAPLALAGHTFRFKAWNVWTENGVVNLLGSDCLAVTF